MEKGEEKTVLFIIKTPILVMSSSAQKSYKLSVYTHNLILDKNPPPGVVNYMYRSVLGKCSWVLNHKSSFFTILGACPVYWVLTVYKNQNRRGQFMGVTLAC